MFFGRAWFLVPLALLIFLLPTWFLRAWLPHQGDVPTPKVSPTAIPLDVAFVEGLQLAANDPLAALPLLEKVAFSDNTNAGNAHTLWQAIQAARLVNEPAYTLTASGRALAAIGQWALARQALVKAVALNPDYAEAWAYLGEAQQQNGEDGLPALQRAESLDPHSVSVHLFLALYWQRQGDYQKADEEFTLAAAQAPSDPLIQIQWGENAVLAGKDGLVYFQRAIELAPEDPQVLKTLANYSIETEVYVEELGFPIAQKLVLDDPDDVSAATLAARAYALLGHTNEALVFFEHAIELDDHFVPAHLHYGIFLLTTGDFEEARNQLNQVVALAPGSREADLAAYWLEQMSH